MYAGQTRICNITVGGVRKNYLRKIEFREKNKSKIWYYV